MKDPLIRCGFGLGNRVAAIANALSLYQSICFIWRNNEQCPVDHNDIFPEGIKGVQFITDAPKGYATKINGRRIHEYESGGDIQSKRITYKLVLDSMIGKPVLAPECSILARFKRFDIRSTKPMMDEILRLNVGSVFVLADSNREILMSELSNQGINVILPTCPEMKFDFDRSKDDVISFCNDWKTLLTSKNVVSTGGRSSLLFPYMIKGRHN